MRTFNIQDLGPQTAALIEQAAKEARPHNLPFGEPLQEVREKLAGLENADLSTHGVPKDESYASCLRSGLWLLFDFELESHALSQKISHASGSYWHGILHRREPDASNARYWFSKVGEHPIFTELAQDASEIIGTSGGEGLDLLGNGKTWDPDEFIRLCTSPQDETTTTTLLKIQRREWELLFDHDYGLAF